MGKKATGVLVQLGGPTSGPTLTGHLTPRGPTAQAPKSQSKQTARAVSSGGIGIHPGLEMGEGLLGARAGSLAPLRLPDMYLNPTAATVLKSEYNISTNADGDAAWGESWGIAGAKLTSVVTAGALAVVVGTAHPQFTSFVAEAKAARMVAMRIQVTYTGRTDEASGYLSHDLKTETAWGGGAIADQHVSSIRQVPATDGMTVFVTYTQEPRWEAPSPAAFMQNTFGVPTFFCSGCVATKPIFHVRVWRFIEYLPFDNSISEGAMDIEPYNPTELAVNASLAATATSVSKGEEPAPSGLAGMANAALHLAAPVGKWVAKEARSYIKGQLISAATSVAPLLLGA